MLLNPRLLGLIIIPLSTELRLNRFKIKNTSNSIVRPKGVHRPVEFKSEHDINVLCACLSLARPEIFA